MDLKAPRDDDNDAMLLWRMTVDPIDNIGEPYQAEWVYLDEHPQDRFSIKQGVQRYVRLLYNNPADPLPGIGAWIPGSPDEYVNFPNNDGVYDEHLPDAYVKHDPIPHGHGLNIQYVPPVKHALMPLGELNEEWVNFLTQQLYGKGRKYIKKFIDRYIVTPRFTVYHTLEYDRRLRNNIFNIFKRASNQAPDEIEDYAWLEWRREVEANPENGYGYDEYNMLFLDPNFLNDDVELGIIYNKRGVKRQPANRAEIETDFLDVQQYFSKIKKTPEPGTRRRRRERKRDKKILKEYRDEMRIMGESPSAIYDGGRCGTRKRKRKNRKSRGKK
jgi:hypothetical protein